MLSTNENCFTKRVVVIGIFLNNTGDGVWGAWPPLLFFTMIKA